MNNRTFAKSKNKNSTAFLPTFNKKTLGQTFSPKSTNRIHETSTPRFGHNFGDVLVESSKSFKQSCPLSLSSPRSCPFGGACHTCPPKIQTKLTFSQSGDKYEQEANRVSNHIYSGKSQCSPTWYGDTSPEVDQEGNFTGKVVVKYNDAVLKDPCVRECVEEHEKTHVRQLTPLVKKIHECDVAAGNDWGKKGKCNAMATRELNEPLSRWECEAYRKSFTCLTFKILDSNSPCSKSPHREEIQKHRSYEACEMKRYCKEAGTSEAGIPKV
jgi:hypothetical protein